MRGGVNVGTKTPILLIVGAFRGAGGAGRWGCPSAVALTCRFSRQEIDVIRGTYALFCSRLLSVSNFFLSVICFMCKVQFYQHKLVSYLGTVKYLVAFISLIFNT